MLTESNFDLNRNGARFWFQQHISYISKCLQFPVSYIQNWDCRIPVTILSFLSHHHISSLYYKFYIQYLVTSRIRNPRFLLFKIEKSDVHKSQCWFLRWDSNSLPFNWKSKSVYHWVAKSITKTCDIFTKNPSFILIDVNCSLVYFICIIIRYNCGNHIQKQGEDIYLTSRNFHKLYDDW